MNAHLGETDLALLYLCLLQQVGSSLDKIVWGFNTNVRVLPPDISQAAHYLLADYILNLGEDTHTEIRSWVTAGPSFLLS